MMEITPDPGGASPYRRRIESTMVWSHKEYERQNDEHRDGLDGHRRASLEHVAEPLPCVCRGGYAERGAPLRRSRAADGGARKAEAPRQGEIMTQLEWSMVFGVFCFALGAVVDHVLLAWRIIKIERVLDKRGL
jgi:hypothetical protein